MYVCTCNLNANSISMLINTNATITPTAINYAMPASKQQATGYHSNADDAVKQKKLMQSPPL